MNKNLAAIVGIVLLGAVTVGCGSAGPSDGVLPTASAVAVANPGPSVQPTETPTPVATVQPVQAPSPVATMGPSETPAPVATPEPAASPSAVPSASPAALPTPTPPETPSTVRVPRLTATVPGATQIRYFRVKGSSPNALLNSAVLRSKASCRSNDTLACVFLGGTIRWTARTAAVTGACTIVTPQVSRTAVVYLPRWDSATRVEPALVAWWKKMADHLAWHEGQHIKIRKAYDAKLVKQMQGHSCSSAQAIEKRWRHDLQAAQHRFDARDIRWPYPDYSGPGGWYGT